MQPSKTKPKWLKRYIKLDHLDDTLRENEIFLGDPSEWPDKNDSGLIKLYSDQFEISDIRVTCLTESPDRFHFWSIFGGRELGVCLWFERSLLLDDIGKDTTLEAGKVQYVSVQGLKRLDANTIPFAKREQYKDEREFRVLRKQSALCSEPTKFKFTPMSLKRIYLNPWLENEDYLKYKKSIFKNHPKFSHVEVMQSKMLNYGKWKRAAKAALSRNSD